MNAAAEADGTDNTNMVSAGKNETYYLVYMYCSTYLYLQCRENCKRASFASRKVHYFFE